MQRMASNILRFGSYKKAHRQSEDVVYTVSAQRVSRNSLLSRNNQMMHNLISTRHTFMCEQAGVCVCP